MTNRTIEIYGLTYR